MKNIIQNIVNKNLVSVRKSIDESMADRISIRLIDLKKGIQAEHFSLPLDEERDLVIEAGRFKIVRARVRAGKVQRRKKVATIDGFTMRDGKVTKMSPRERQNRKISQKKARFKRRAKKHQARRSTVRAMRKRKSVGLK